MSRRPHVASFGISARNKRRLAGGLFACRFTLTAPLFSGREQIVILINLRSFLARVFISGTPRSTAASVGGLMLLSFRGAPIS